MSSLLELQRSLRAALLAGSDAANSAVIGETAEAAARLRIYRNNMLGNLTGTLRLTFPAVERLVGADFFAAAAARFIPTAPPVNADLYQYGAAFPAFLAGFEPAQGLAYLADVARLEWAVSHALHAPLVPALTVSALRGIPESRQADLRFTPHPSLSLLALEHPAKAIWTAVLDADAQARAAALTAIDVTAAGDCLAVLRGRDGLAVLTLSPAAYRLACALADRQPLADALAVVPPDDAAALLGDFIAHGLFGGCDLPEHLTQQAPGWNR